MKCDVTYTYPGDALHVLHDLHTHDDTQAHSLHATSTSINSCVWFTLTLTTNKYYSSTHVTVGVQEEGEGASQGRLPTTGPSGAPNRHRN